MKKFYQTLQITCLITLLLLILQQAYCDPYRWGCTKWMFQIGGGKICTQHGLISVPESIDLCPGDTLTLFGRIPDGTTCSYQWYTTYEIPGNPGYYYYGKLIGATNNKLFLSNEDTEVKVRGYWCRMICGVDTTFTDHVNIWWNLEPEIKPEGDLNANYYICDENSASLNFKVTAHNNYQWSSSPNGIDWSVIPDINDSEYTFTTHISNNFYQYKCKAYNGCGEVSSSVATLNVKELPQIDLGDDKKICNGETLTLDAGPGFSVYQWNTGKTTRDILINEGGTYSVTVTGANGCQNSDTISVIVDPNLIPVNLGNDKRICYGDSVYLDAGTGYDHYNWSNTSTSQAIYIKETGNYSVDVYNDDNVCHESDEVFIEVAKPFADEKICVVTIDSATRKNLIVWEKTTDAGVVSYNIYRETTIGKYDSIGSVNATDLSVFLDPTAMPENRTYLYRITVVDTCGNESLLEDAPYHSPNFLQYVSADKGINLEWTGYSIEGVTDIGEYLISYVIYRGTDSTELTEYQTVGSIKNFTDTDPDALSRRYYYRVAGILKDPCKPTSGKKVDSGPYSQSMSNIEDNRIESTSVPYLLQSVLLSVTPNPFSESAILRFNNPEDYPYLLYITDLSGKICRIVENISASSYVLERKDLKPGMYFIELRGSSIIRGKFMIE